MAYAILAVALIAIDQLVKYLVLEHIALGASVPFIPYLVELTFVKNTGAAFSMLADHTWILAITSAVMSLVLAYAIAKKFFSHPFGRTSLTIIFAGAVGNLIDRAFRGYVVDMFNLEFMNFAVFNVADICVCVGGFCAAVYYLFYYEKLENGALND